MYVTLDDLLARFPEADLVQLTDDEGAGAIDVSRIDRAIASAGTIIDGYVAAKYRTGQLPTPPLLTELAGDIVLFRLHERRDTPPERVSNAHDRALAMLAQIAKGTIKLDVGEETLAPRPGAVLVSRPTRLFGRDDMQGF
jgi:phage gp36-like protein